MDRNMRFELLFIILFLLVVFFVFTPVRSRDDTMRPGIGDGDLVFCYRVHKNYAQNDLTVYEYNNKSDVRRVVAVAGDTVDIKDSCLIINGYKQNELYVSGATNAYRGLTSFPLTLKKGEVFLMADNREGASDSRAYGPVKSRNTRGVVLAVIRHRGI